MYDAASADTKLAALPPLADSGQQQHRQALLRDAAAQSQAESPAAALARPLLAEVVRTFLAELAATPASGTAAAASLATADEPGTAVSSDTPASSAAAPAAASHQQQQPNADSGGQHPGKPADDVGHGWKPPRAAQASAWERCVDHLHQQGSEVDLRAVIPATAAAAAA